MNYLDVSFSSTYSRDDSNNKVLIGGSPGTVFPLTWVDGIFANIVDAGFREEPIRRHFSPPEDQVAGL